MIIAFIDNNDNGYHFYSQYRNCLTLYDFAVNKATCILIAIFKQLLSLIGRALIL